MRQYGLDSLDHVKTTSGATLLILTIERYKESFAPKLLHWLLNQGATRIELKMAIYAADGMPPSLQAMNRLLLQQDAVYAVSWLWTNSIWTKSTTKSPLRLPRFCWKRSTTSTSGVALRGLLRYTRKL